MSTAADETCWSIITDMLAWIGFFTTFIHMTVFLIRIVTTIVALVTNQFGTDALVDACVPALELIRSAEVEYDIVLLNVSSLLRGLKCCNIQFSDELNALFLFSSIYIVQRKVIICAGVQEST